MGYILEHWRRPDFSNVHHFVTFLQFSLVLLHTYKNFELCCFHCQQGFYDLNKFRLFALFQSNKLCVLTMNLYQIVTISKIEKREIDRVEKCLFLFTSIYKKKKRLSFVVRNGELYDFWISIQKSIFFKFGIV